MEDFQFKSPTHFVLRHGAELQAGELVREQSQKVLVVLGGDFVKESPWYPGLITSLADAGVEVHELSGIQPNPTLTAVRKGIEIVKDQGIGMVLSVGGGSAIDSAKAIAIGALADEDVWSVFTKEVEVSDALPVGCVMTIPSTGSEASNGSVINNAETGEKFDVMGDFIRPVFALMDPVITFSAPRRQVMAGIVDMFSHAAERYFSRSMHVELTDRLGEAVMIAIMHNARILLTDFTNYDARADLMVASLLAHNGLTGIGRQQDWASHAVAAPLSGEYNAVHGETISVIMPAWAAYVAPEAPERFALLGVRVFGADPGAAQEDKARAAIDGMRAFFDELGMPATLAELGIEDDSRFVQMAAQATHFYQPGNLKSLTSDDVMAIYRLAC